LEHRVHPSLRKKTVKSPYLCNLLTDFVILMKFGTVMHIGPQRLT